MLPCGTFKLACSPQQLNRIKKFFSSSSSVSHWNSPQRTVDAQKRRKEKSFFVSRLFFVLHLLESRLYRNRHVSFRSFLLHESVVCVWIEATRNNANLYWIRNVFFSSSLLSLLLSVSFRLRIFLSSLLSASCERVIRLFDVLTKRKRERETNKTVECKNGTRRRREKKRRSACKIRKFQ